MKKVLITGASGFFGQNLINFLSLKEESNNKYYCLYNTRLPETVSEQFEFIKCDLFNKEQVEEILQEIKPTHCIHLAWYVPPKKFWNAIENVDWLYASVYLFRVFCDNGGKLFMGAGTLAEYDWTSGILDDEIVPVNPGNLYGQSKKSLHDIIQIVKKNEYPNVCLIWLRIGYFFGPGESKEKLISKVISNLYHGLPIDLASRAFSRPYAHVKYASMVMHYFLGYPDTKDVSLNLSASHCVTLEEIVNFIIKKIKSENPCVNYGKYNAFPNSVFVKSKLENFFEFEISKNFFSDLNDFIEFYIRETIESHHEMLPIRC